MSADTRVVPCQHCGGYKVSQRVSWATRGRRKLTVVLLVLMVTMVMAFRLHRCYSPQQKAEAATARYDRWMPLVFVGGVPRSGSSLMRALLDAHPLVRCGPDTRVIPRVLQMYHHWLTQVKERTRLQEAGVHSEVLQSAVAALCLEIIVHHGDSAPRLCNKDPLTLQFAFLLSQLFPNAKFLWVVRDARATVHSIISRQISVARYNPDSYGESLSQWNTSTAEMLEQCQRLGAGRCLTVRYEQLVLRPQQIMAHVLRFLDLPWDDAVLHHEEAVGKPGGIRLSRFERASAEVRRAIHHESLTRWVDRIPAHVLVDLPRLAPMMAVLGYDPADGTPHYHSMASTIWSMRNDSLIAGDT